MLFIVVYLFLAGSDVVVGVDIIVFVFLLLCTDKKIENSKGCCHLLTGGTLFSHDDLIGGHFLIRENFITSWRILNVDCLSC